MYNIQLSKLTLIGNAKYVSKHAKRTNKAVMKKYIALVRSFGETTTITTLITATTVPLKF